jgi:hypothetical protein
MVVGQVQSGKTANYSALICKAADAGYRFVVVLAGLHNSLRSQTQRRLDEGFLGLDSRTSLAFANTNRRIGVGAGGRKHPPAYTLTSSDERGDFARAVAGRVAGRIGSDSVLLVVKKHKTILTNLIEWVTSINGRPDPRTGRMIVSDFPLLVIDDEADNASVNTKRIEYERDLDGEIVSETDPSEINRLIRRLLHSFERSSFVSYTATPFANIFIDEEVATSAHGEDLFPRSFVLRIPPPSNYVGPAEVFGIPAAEDPSGDGRPGLPVVRPVRDNEEWLRTGHRREATPGALPASMREAIRSFMIVCAARAARGEVDVHNSMLVHVTRFVRVQEQIAEQIQAALEALQDGIRGADPSLLAELKELWERDFEPTSRRMPAELRGAPVDWESVAERLPAAVERIRPVLLINGSARDSLTYSDHPNGVSVIAVGGDKLSRGLTLEGLSVSYYLRASRMYDTLMQMGRWFGYRDGYTDLIRLYTTRELTGWYRDITIANEELGAKFDEMARVGSNPRDFALYVRKSPAGLLITGQAKMRSGRTMELTFSGDVIETIGFRRDASVQRANLQLVEQFLESQTRSGRLEENTEKEHPRWRAVPGVEVAAMLEQFTTVDAARKARGTLLARYVRSRLPHGELEDWTVIAVNNRQPGRKSIPTAGFELGLTMRSPYPPGEGRDDPIEERDDYTIRRLASPGHEQLDLDPEELALAERLRAQAAAAALERARLEGRPDPSEPAIGPFVRKARPVGRGLLILYWLDPGPACLTGVGAIPGFLVSFPESPGAPTISYVVPRRYWEQEAA